MVRINFEEELDTAEKSLLAQSALVHKQLDRVMSALEHRDVPEALAIVAKDDRVDDIYLATQTRILNLLALQAPVAKDLRLVSAILHSNMHVERMGDLCVNIAKFVTNDHPYPTSSPMLGRLDEMGQRAGEMLQTAMRAFTERNVDLAEELPERDAVLNRLNRGMLDDLRDYAGDEESFEWAVNLILVARYLERFGDHSVDVGEQTHFLVTGVFREFTDASHPELRPQGG
jgi:phosphate transport system protein